ncbi:thioesterase family protein [Acinetobacter baumannii]|uniref:acyl-CoA thioesterase n=1 Tax=Acinetobacter baumannii TaxID=470 RepID=UPI002A181C44|nr:thioesterase family protein [Acinetobacter baumannii]
MKELSVYPVIYDQKVAWGDMDAFGHVNNVQYYRYIESSRILYMEKALLHKAFDGRVFLSC